MLSARSPLPGTKASTTSTVIEIREEKRGACALLSPDPVLAVYDRGEDSPNVFPVQDVEDTRGGRDTIPRIL